MSNTFLSRFNPNLMSPETLEEIFVQRHELVEELIKAIRDSVLTKNKHFRLLVGMRGIGKSHTIALLYYRLVKQEDLRDKLVIAWLQEEEWGVSSFLDLLIRIFRALEKEHPREYQQTLQESVEFLYQLSPEEAEKQAGRLLKEFIGNRTLLLLIENLDEIFKGLGDIGQKQLRAYIQNYGFITIIATAQSLFAEVSLQDHPFYGFFFPYELDKLNLDQANCLLTKIAQLEQDEALKNFLQTTAGKARIAAIHHLAGGNHRVYVIFSQFLTRESLDQLVDPFMQTLDDLTPYYQARMQWLSPQQRKIVEFLCDRAHAVSVKEIAQRCFITHQTASSQLKDLRDKGYVTAEASGRESFYELQEPLMRICLEVKKQRGEPIRLFINFLKIWYAEEELKQRLQSLPDGSVLERQYIQQVLQEISLVRQQDRDRKEINYPSWLKKFVIQSFELVNELNFQEEIPFFRDVLLAELESNSDASVIYPLLQQNLDILNNNFERILETWATAVFEQSNTREKEAIAELIKNLSDHLLDPRLPKKADSLEIAITGFETILRVYQRDLMPEKWATTQNNLAIAYANKGGVENLDRAIAAYENALLERKRETSPYDWATTQNNLGAAYANKGGVENLDRAITAYENALLERKRETSPYQWASTQNNLRILADAIIPVLFQSVRDPDIWRKKLKTWISLYDKQDILSALGKGLTETIAPLMSEMVSNTAAQKWLEVWQALAQDKPDLQIPLRFLSTAVEYKHKKRDRKVLLQLAKEERQLLESLLEKENH